MSDVAIKVEGLGKAYRLGAKHERADTLVGALLSAASAPIRNYRRLRSLDTFSTDRSADDVLWALKDVSFEVGRGEVVGVLGRNGAGKSTLLKILSRITEPTEGRVTIRGRISSLLEVGTGFHPELTGRENVYMNGTILGMRRREIDRKFDEIVEFSGVERFLDTPVKRYSSGMKVRLGFSVAAHLEPEVLIVDEVLAVGDGEFQRKCLGKMQDVAGSGRTVLFVSHNMGAIQNLCTRAVALRSGCLVDDAPTGDAIRNYLASLARPEVSGISPDNPERLLVGDIYLTGGRVLDAQGIPTEYVTAGEAVTFEFDYANPKAHPSFDMAFEIRNGHGIGIHHFTPDYTGARIVAEREGRVRCTLPRLALPIGDYSVRTAINLLGRKSDHIPTAMRFSVQASTYYGTGRGPRSEISAALTDHRWEMIGAEQPALQLATD